MRTVSRTLRSFPAALAGLLLAILLAVPVSAAPLIDASALDKLFADLKSAPDAQTAYGIDQHIWDLWTTPQDPELAAQMQDVLAARRSLDFSGAIALLDRITASHPDYAEAFNQRATLYYLLNDYDHALADIDTTLRLEPRHFGALSGRAVIYLAQHKRALALADMRTALAIHPFLAERQLFPELLQDVTRI